ncbi:MAG: histidinol-phosphate transaminase [Casimicrobiaceae bacterium]
MPNSADIRPDQDPSSRDAAAAERAASFVRPEIRALAPYHVADAAGMIKLDAMENPYALPDAVRSRMASVVADVAVNRYPDGAARRVAEALRATFAIGPELGLMLGNGSDELIQIVTCTLAAPGAVMLAPEPTFVMYRSNALYAGMRFVGVDLLRDWNLDMPAMRRAIAREQPALVFLAYPNNPTGNLFRAEEVDEIVALAPGLVVIDEAYAAFASASFLGRAADYPNVVILRTVSKIGMAGLRLGYAVGPRAWIGEFDKVRAPYNLNVLTQAVVPLLLGEPDLLAGQAAAIRAERQQLAAAIARVPGLATEETQANFLVVRVPDAPRWFAGLARAGILVKNLHGMHPLLANCLRVTVGTPAENAAVVNALEALA